MTNNQTAIPTPESLLQHASWAHSLARSLVGEAAADDLVQDTWLAAIKANPSADRPLRPWLGTVLGNLSRQESRSSARRKAREAEVAQTGFEPSAEELTEKAESQKLLMEQLLQLDEELREVLLLKFFEGLSAAEIGRRKGVPAVRSRAVFSAVWTRCALPWTPTLAGSAQVGAWPYCHFFGVAMSNVVWWVLVPEAWA